jgi:hypothetical protein
VGSTAWVLVVVATALIVVALVVFVVPLGRRGSAPPGRDAPSPSSSSSSSEALARGFGYLHVSSRSVSRRGGVHERLARAFARIDAVDPHAAPRRIGEALVQAGLADPLSPPPAEPRTTSFDQPRDLR